MGSFGQIKEFDASTESWTLYTERLEQFFIANGITDGDRKRAIFLTVVGPGTYALIRNLLSPAAPSTKTLTEIITVLNSHFDPAPSVIVERYKFNSRVRRAGESVANFVAELRSLAKHCAYGTSLDEMLRDRIVCGIQDEGIQRKLLAENQLTLTRATEIAVTMETAARDASNLRTASGSSSEVNKIQFKKNFSNTSKSSTSRAKNQVAEKCSRCGGSHQSSECRFKNSTCHNCKKIGHIAKVCRSKKKNLSEQVHNVQLEEPEYEVSNVYTLFNLSGLEETFPPARIKCLIQGKPFIFEVDSGAPFTIMPLNIFNEVKQYLPPLEPTSIKLNSYTQHPIAVIGMAQVEVKYESKSCSLPLMIVEQGKINLAGRNWIYPLQLMKIFTSPSHSYAVNNLPNPKLTLQNLLEQFKDLFSSELGVLKDVKVHLMKKESASPRFFKARPVPYALRDRVDQEIVRLVKVGILEPVKTAESAAPIVPVLKRDGRIRVCGDFKLTTNKVTEL